MLSSCRNDIKDMFDPNAVALRKMNEYSKAFVKQFGNIDPDHTWGFGRQLNARGSEPQAVDNPQNLGITHPDAVTEAEIEKVTNWFKDNQYPKSVDVSWSEFWIQKVSSNPAYSQWMKYLKVNGEGVDRFNNSEGDSDMMYVVNSNTVDFSYQNTHENTGEGEGDDSHRHYDYVICEIDGDYYVGFDFMSTKSGEEVALDGYYWDWIVKITPARYINVHRIIAEDLGTIGDFDFNDVVFDVKFEGIWEEGQYVEFAEVTLVAAGGMLPLYICCGDQEIEVHEKFGVSTDIMVNTGAANSSATCDKVTFRLNDCTGLADIKVKVGAQDAEYYLTSSRGEAPQMICVTTDFVTAAERQRIDSKYPMFEQYVANQEVSWY